ncbi:MAG: preprotein translocase subunit YajC [Planctomycetaceae bacterium]|nr:MAG: preprotein translocase subunit YajC [Planctomycetaceae bacterium]
MDSLWILAQAGSPEAPSRIGSEPVGTDGQSTTQAPGSPNTGPEGVPPQKPGSPWSMLLMMVAVFAVMYMLLLRGPRKQQQQQKQMVQSLKKNDRVRTIGGIYGTVMDVKGDEVILKIDEATNTKIHVSTSAIGKNLSQDGGKE